MELSLNSLLSEAVGQRPEPCSSMLSATPQKQRPWELHRTPPRPTEAKSASYWDLRAQ